MSSSCFRIELQDQKTITLQSLYPISDEEGMKLSPYTFTITNMCDIYASYEVNLEQLNVEGKRLSGDFFKYALNDVIGSLKNENKVKPTISNALESYHLTTGILEPKDTVTYQLKLWLDEETLALEEVMNANFSSKVTVTSSYQDTLIITYLDQVQAPFIPTKEDKYKFEKYECNNGIKLTWNNDSWDYTLTERKTNSNQDVCKIYFKTITYDVILYSEQATFEKNKVLTNLIKNGNFENDLKDWSWEGTAGTKGIITNENCVSGKCLEIQDINNKACYWLMQTYHTQPKMNDYIYQGGSVYVKDSKTNGLFFTLGYVDKTDVLEYVNFIENTSSYKNVSLMHQKKEEGTFRTQIGSNFSNTSIGYFDNIYVINLTETFGSGQEPTKEWVEKYIPYFDTTANIAIEQIEKLETKSFSYFLDKEVNVECLNADYKVKNNTLEISNATKDVYCKLFE